MVFGELGWWRIGTFLEEQKCGPFKFSKGGK
jgi:hypothetical protein